MKTISKVALAATIASFATSTSFAQLALGEDCGCPALGSRTDVNMSTLATGDELQGSITLTCDNTYLLDDLLYVPDGAELTIEPGTVIRGPSWPGR